MYVYITPSLEDHLNQQEVERIKSIKTRIEAGDLLTFGLLFSPRFPHWVKRIANKRLIATLKQIEGEWILCLIDLLNRGSHEYRDFLDSPERWGVRKINLKEDTLRLWLSERRVTSPVFQRTITPEMLPWLERPTLLENYDRIISESKLWVDQWANSDTEIVQNSRSFHRIVHHLVEDNGCQVKSSQYPGVQVCIDPESECAVLFSTIRPVTAASRETIFLLSTHTEAPNHAEIAEVGNKLGMFGSQVSENLFAGNLTNDDLARFARRTYPDYLIGDYDTWLNVECDIASNMALSGEEENLLDEMRFPAFINGRAGSGKSTMLYHAFAYYCDLYLRNMNQLQTCSNKQIPVPLFLTYSERLTERAYEVTKGLLKGHVNFIESAASYSEDWETRLRHCFSSFRSLLLNQLTPDEMAQFSIGKYMSFHRFKSQYRRSFPGPRYSAELCWHVIRTYIKGYSFSEGNDARELLSKEDFQDEVPQSRKSVDLKTFSDIHEQVWRWYQRLQNAEGYWDDQDLVRAVLNRNLDSCDATARGAIFCDEAQDFTHIELQVILRLSVWSNYRLYPPVNSLPFAFAGDPMQTLNPTGFGWEGLRANFYETIIRTLDPDGNVGLNEPDFSSLKELRQNYRSTSNIVRFSNLIHLWRKVLFDLKSLQPQLSWWVDQAELPVQKGILGKNVTPEELKRIANGDAIFILPCDSGEELEFLKSCSESIRRAFPDLERNVVPSRAYSAIEVKGMEFSSVVVFGFGEYFAREFPSLNLEDILRRETPEGHGNRDLKLEYFLNKLYVGVSRSKQVLGIVDTQAGQDALWHSAEDKGFWTSQLPVQHRKAWLEKTDGIQNGFSLNVFQGSCSIEQAEQFMHQGIEHGNQRFLETAADYFRRADRLPEAQYCDNWVLRLNGHLREAGQGFMQLSGLADASLKPSTDAWRCFWEGQHWDDLLAWYELSNDRLESPWKPAVQFMVRLGRRRRPTELNIDEVLSGVYEFTHFVSMAFPDDHCLIAQCTDSTWQAVFAGFRICVEVVVNSSVLQAPLRPDDVAPLIDLLVRLGACGFSHDPSVALAARCASKVQSFDQACALWEQCSDSTHRESKEFYLAKARTLPVPDNVSWLRLANETLEIVEQWKAISRPSFEQSVEQWKAVLDDLCYALRRHNEHIELLNIDIAQARWIRVVDRVKERQEANDPDFTPKLRLHVLQRMSEASTLTPEGIEREAYELRRHPRVARESLWRFVSETTQLPEWLVSVDNLRRAGLAFQRIGEFVPELSFYERFRQHPNPRFCELAREEWVRVRLRQADYEVSRGRPDVAEGLRSSANRMVENWVCAPQVSET